MSDLLQIQEPTGAKPAARPEWAAFLEMGFRPLYIGGAFWAALSVLLWVHTPTWLLGHLGGAFWHAHEMLWGFIATIAVAFLLTAVGNWTGRNPIKGGPLAALSALWLAARLLYLWPGKAAFVAAALCETAFFLWAVLAIGRSIYGTKNRRNYGVPLALLGLGAANAAFLWAWWQGSDYAALMRVFDWGLFVMAMIALLVARRVLPFFAMRAVAGLQVPMLVRSGHVQMWATGLALLALLLGWVQVAAALLALTALVALGQWLLWRPWASRSIPLLWVLYVGYAVMALGLLLAAWQLWPHGNEALQLRAAWPVHVIGVGGFAVLIIGMLTRTALGHLGRPLKADGLMVVCYGLVLLAALARLLALYLLGEVALPVYEAVLYVSTCAWALAFALYLWRFVPWLIRPRLNPPPPVMVKK